MIEKNRILQICLWIHLVLFQSRVVFYHEKAHTVHVIFVSVTEWYTKEARVSSSISFNHVLSNSRQRNPGGI